LKIDLDRDECFTLAIVLCLLAALAALYFKPW